MAAVPSGRRLSSFPTCSPAHEAREIRHIAVPRSRVESLHVESGCLASPDPEARSRHTPLGGRMDIERIDLRIAEIATDPDLRRDVRWWLIDELLEWRTALASV